MSVGTQKAFLNIFFLIVGLISSLFVYLIVLRTTDNPILAVISMVVTQAFWIGVLTASIKVKF